MRFEIVMKEKPSRMPLLVKNLNVFIVVAVFWKGTQQFQSSTIKPTAYNVITLKTCILFMKKEECNVSHHSPAQPFTLYAHSFFFFLCLMQKMIKIFQTYFSFYSVLTLLWVQGPVRSLNPTGDIWPCQGIARFEYFIQFISQLKSWWVIEPCPDYRLMNETGIQRQFKRAKI